MNVPFLIAGALALVGALIHGIAGEAIVVMKLRTESLPLSPFGGPTMTKLMIRATWHITTLAFVVIGSALIGCAPGDASQMCKGIGRLAAVSYASFGAMAIGLVVAARRFPRALLQHPAPVVFGGVAVLAWWGGS